MRHSNQSYHRTGFINNWSHWHCTENTNIYMVIRRQGWTIFTTNIEHFSVINRCSFNWYRNFLAWNIICWHFCNLTHFWQIKWYFLLPDKYDKWHFDTFLTTGKRWHLKLIQITAITLYPWGGAMPAKIEFSDQTSHLFKTERNHQLDSMNQDHLRSGPFMTFQATAESAPVLPAVFQLK